MFQSGKLHRTRKSMETLNNYFVMNCTYSACQSYTWFFCVRFWYSMYSNESNFYDTIMVLCLLRMDQTYFCNFKTSNHDKLSMLSICMKMLSKTKALHGRKLIGAKLRFFCICNAMPKVHSFTVCFRIYKRNVLHQVIGTKQANPWRHC